MWLMVTFGLHAHGAVVSSAALNACVLTLHGRRFTFLLVHTVEGTCRVTVVPGCSALSPQSLLQPLTSLCPHSV